MFFQCRKKNAFTINYILLVNYYYLILQTIQRRIDNYRVKILIIHSNPLNFYEIYCYILKNTYFSNVLLIM